MFWWLQSLLYMDHLESLGTSRLAGVAYTQPGMQERGWRQAAMDGLALMGVTPPPPGASLDIGAAISTLTATAQTAVLTPAQPASHMDLVYYSHKSSFCMEPYLLSVSNQKLRCALARFRLGQHWLQTRWGRFGPNHIPYDQRFCPHCAHAAENAERVVDSEHHFLFSCPKYADIRQQPQFAAIAQLASPTLTDFLSLPPLLIARYLNACHMRHLGKNETLAEEA